MFHQLLRGADKAQRAQLQLLPSSQYSYLGGGAAGGPGGGEGGVGGVGGAVPPGARSARSDGLKLAETLQAMGCVGISPSHQQQLLRLLGALLHLGNVTLRARGDGEGGGRGGDASCVVAEGSGATALARACGLLRCAPLAVGAALCTRRIEAGGECMTLPVSPEAAARARDGLAKALYGRLFNHVVRCVNRALGGQPSTPRRGARGGSHPPGSPQMPRTPEVAAAEEEDKEAAAEEEEAAEAEAEAAWQGEAEGAMADASGAGSDYWSDAPLDAMPSPAPNVARKRSYGGGGGGGGGGGNGAGGGGGNGGGVQAEIAGRICCLDIFGFECFGVNGFEQVVHPPSLSQQPSGHHPTSLVMCPSHSCASLSPCVRAALHQLHQREAAAALHRRRLQGAAGAYTPSHT